MNSIRSSKHLRGSQFACVRSFYQAYLWMQAQQPAPPLVVFWLVFAVQPTAPQWIVFDGDVRQIFGNNVITPDSVRGSASTLRDALRSGNPWPTLQAARGKVMVVLDSPIASVRLCLALITGTHAVLCA